MTAQCLISFGSNLGNRDQLIAEAAGLVSKSDLLRELRTSRLFETPPIGGPDGQEPFLNAVAAFDTEAPARKVLEFLQQVERRLGRQRRRRWDARSIDLDVVLHGQLVGGGTGLIVPHPRYTARQFVLQPACDVAPHYRDPRFGWSLEQLAAHLRRGVPSMALVGGSEATRNELCRRLREQHGICTFEEGVEVTAQRIELDGVASRKVGHTTEAADRGPVERDGLCDASWVSAFVPNLPDQDSGEMESVQVPRLIARIQSTSAVTRWPAPHQMWPAGWQWPEYRLEIDDLNWAVAEIVSALQSMRCTVQPVTSDGRWWC